MEPVPTIKRAKRISGIGVAAAALGVTRQHLRLVIIDSRKSETLLARYHALTAAKPSKQISP